MQSVVKINIHLMKYDIEVGLRLILFKFAKILNLFQPQIDIIYVVVYNIVILIGYKVVMIIWFYDQFLL